MGFIGCLPVSAQVGSTIKKISKGLVQKTVKKTTKKEVKTYGRNAVEKATVSHALKKGMRERMEKQMKKDGIKSFFEYGNKKVLPKLAHTRLSLVRDKMNKSNYKAALKGNSLKSNILEPGLNSNLRKGVNIIAKKEGQEMFNDLSTKNPELYDVIVNKFMKKGGPLQEPYWNKFVCEYGEHGELIIYNLRPEANNTAIMIKGDIVKAYSGCTKGSANEAPNLFLDYLLPNKTYFIDDGKYTFKTDRLKRTTWAKAVYTNQPVSYKTGLDNVRRDNVQRMKQGRGTNIDDAGHIFQHNRGGINEIINLVPMDNAWQRNGAWRKLEIREEKIIQKALTENKRVESTRRLFYEGNSSRPSKILVQTFVDGKKVLSEMISCP